ncbi:peptidase [Pseudomonas aeruginosa]|nr:peptidase [Pseudomonas aeruginosa]
MEFTEAILQEIAATYDPALSEAPLVIGHPKLNAPAYGWAKGLEVREGMLYAEPHQVVPEFAEAANRKMYKKRSASVYLPDSPGNPVPGKHYLRHIGFLGAVPPAIKGIPDALNFAEDDGDLVIEFAEAPYAVTALTEILRRLRDFFVEREGAERADQLIPQWQLSSIEEDARRAVTHGAGIQASFSEPAIEGVDAAAASAAAAEEPQGTVTPSDGASESAAEADRTSHPSQQDTTMSDEAALDERNASSTSASNNWPPAKHRWPSKKPRNIATRSPSSPKAWSMPADSAAPEGSGDRVAGESACRHPPGVRRGRRPGHQAGGRGASSLLAELPKQVDFSEKSGDGGDLSFGSAHAIAARAQSYQEEQRQAGRHISTTEAVTHITKGAK